MPWSWPIAAFIGGLLTPAATVRGFHGLDPGDVRPSGRVLTVAVVVGLFTGAGGYAASTSAGSRWWLPGLLGWAVTLSAAAVCDAVTQRIPTTLIRVGGTVTFALLVLATVATGGWRAGARTVVAALICGGLLALCWRFAGAGFGDVRLAALGGMGLGHSDRVGLECGLIVFASLTLAQGIWTFAKTRDRHAMLAYGPALAAAFIVAAAA